MESTAGYPTASNIPIVAKSMPPAQRLWGKPRERIMHLLDRSRRQRFTFLNAPAGYGKTTALADWFYSLTNAGEKAAWFTIDRRDRDSKCFWLNFHYAICTALGLDFEKSLGAVSSMARNKAILTMANEMSLSARKCGGLFIVIEGLDVIYGFETLEELLTLMLALSGNVHIILSSRVAFTKHSFPGFTIPDVALNIDYSMLALTKQEMLEYLLDTGVEQVEEPDLSLLHDKTQGWPAGTAIVMDSVDAGVSFKEAVANLSGTDPRLNEFFEFEVFSGLSQEEKDFLLKTASLGMISTRVAGYTLGDVDVDTVISSLHRRNAFFFPIDTNSGEYELHPLFSQWVMKKAQILSSHEQRLLNARASRWCLRNGLATAAAKHKILASEREDIFNLVRVAYPNMTTAELMSITMFRRDIDIKELSPCFYLLAAWAYAYSAQLDELDFWLKPLHELPDELVDERLRLSLEVIKVKELCLASKFDDGIEKAHQVESRLAGKDFIPLKVILANCRSEALDQQGKIQEGLERHLEFASLTSDGSFPFLSSINSYSMAFSYFEQGNLKHAAQMCRQIQTSYAPDYVTCGAACSLEVLIDVLSNNNMEREQRLAKATSLISKRSNVDMFLDWCTARAWTYVSAGDIDKADAILRESMSLVKMSLSFIPRMAAVQPFQNHAMLMLLEGRVQEALASYREFDMLGLAMTAQSRLVREFVELSIVDEEEREKRLLALLEIAGSHEYNLIAQLLMLEVALIYFERGQRTRAVREIDLCVSRAQENDIVAIFGWKARQVRSLLMVYLTIAKPSYKNRHFAQSLLRQDFMQLREGEEDQLSQAVKLTSKELEVIKLALSGMDRKEISQELCISESTVKSHLSHMYRKFGVKRYSELVALAAELGIS